MNELLIYFSYINRGDNYKIFKDLVNKKRVEESNIQQVLNNLKREGVKYITVFDDEYPQALKALKYAPYVIYYKGNLDILNKNLICLTGDINNNDTDKFIEKSIDNFSKNFALITTDFSQMDRNIAKYFRQNNNQILHILASGHSYLSPNVNIENELYISQYPPQVNPKLQRFKERNILTAAIGKHLVIYGSKEGSGIINLAYSFTDFGKNVYCYPSTNLEDGNNFLLKNGANLITHIADLVTY
ncbi:MULTISPECIES: DNA-processing protein DprA [unclassified Mycoplasma]|uniref:DNA-processing protein DprA n=1 Tax=unclassified Mycoplasma TaxID=2683645 RepID=UPI00216B5617|nr:MULTISPECIES: DNA-processing protein DprA [unclassified Mycoplasma]MCS4536908.1 DNA-processing protein DprA [Mycoplasma sp. CSL7475-4]MCT4469438.1 DNA-processing protein DprA [Mycoplasma sp. HS2188]